MYLLYNLLGLVYLVFVGPYYLWRMLINRQYREGLGTRFGRLSEDVEQELMTHEWIWVHAVSVGEVLAARPLIKEMKARCHSQKIVISTVTPTGQQLARETEEADLSIYLPVDIFGWAVKRVVKTIQPKVLVLMETELWPNLIRHSSRLGVPVVMVNGRISDRSYRRYRRVKFFFKGILKKIAFFGMQTSEDGERIQAMGAPAQRVHTTGSCKFDTVEKPPESDLAEYMKMFNPSGSRKIIVAGSTHPGEEEFIFRVFERVKSMVPSLFLIIAPRHVDRATSIHRSLVSSFAAKVVLRSEFTDEKFIHSDVAILDTIGELAKIYNLADLVIIGKSFMGEGGQNPMEPASVGKPVIVGPHMENFREVTQLLVENGGVIQVQNEEELYQHVVKIILEPSRGKEIGKKGLEVIERHRGASIRNAEQVCNLINSEDDLKIY